MPLTEQEIETYHRDDYTFGQVIDGGQVDLNLARDIVLEAGQLLQKQLAASD